MNRRILAGACRGVRSGSMAKLAGSPALDTASPRQERLNALLADREQAMQTNDGDALAFVEHRIDRLFEEARSARTEQARDPETGQFVSFDGGVHGRRPAPMSGGTMPTASQLMRQAMSASRVERAQRNADPGHTIIANI